MVSDTIFEKADFLRNLFDVFPSFLFVVDEDVRIFHLNSAALRLSHADKDEILLKRGGEVIRCIHCSPTPHDGGCGCTARCRDCVVRNSVSRAFQGGKVIREAAKMELWTNGRVSDVHFMVTAGPLRYGERNYVLLIMEDITDLRNTAAELEQRTAELEAANRELETFSYSVAHDLKAPLNNICGFSEVLLESCAPRLDEKNRDCLVRIHSASTRMSEFIDDMLSFSRAVKGDLGREDVDLSAIAKAAADEALLSDAGRSLEFVIQPGLRAFCNAPLAKILLQNLISNAVKYTAAHRSARIAFGMAPQRGRPVYYVSDDGCGFDMTAAGDLFAPFKRLHNSSRFPGTGIGLATVERIIHRHGGRVWAESAVEKGATFYFTLEPAG